MRILHVHNQYRLRGGEDVVVEQERRLLAEHGHTVVPFTVDNPGDGRRAAAATARAPWNRRAAANVVRAALEGGVEVAHVHNTWFALSPAVHGGLRAAGIPVVATLHNFRTSCANGLLLRDGQDCTLCVGTHPAAAIRHRCYRGSFGLSAVAAATIVAPRVRHTWERDVARFLVLDDAAVAPIVAGGIPAGRVHVQPNFVPDPGPRPRDPSASDEVLFVGRLSEEKGAQFLVEAWAHRPPRGLRLTIYGSGPLAGALAGRRVPGVTVAGMVDRAELAGAMLGARALVVPSLCREAGPLAPAEAAAAGLPLVVSSMLGMADRVAERGAGWVFPSGQLDGLAEALEMAGDPAASDRAGRAARRLFEDRHAAGVAAESLIAHYQAARYAQGSA